MPTDAVASAARRSSPECGVAQTDEFRQRGDEAVDSRGWHRVHHGLRQRHLVQQRGGEPFAVPAFGSRLVAREDAMSEHIREILKQEQEHQIDLATALGEDPPNMSE